METWKFPILDGEMKSLGQVAYETNEEYRREWAELKPDTHVYWEDVASLVKREVLRRARD